MRSSPNLCHNPLLTWKGIQKHLKVTFNQLQRERYTVHHREIYLLYKHRHTWPPLRQARRRLGLFRSLPEARY